MDSMSTNFKLYRKIFKVFKVHNITVAHGMGLVFSGTCLRS